MQLKVPVWCSLYTRKQLRVNMTQGEYMAAARDALPRILVHKVYNDLRGCQLEERLLLTSSRQAWNGMFSLYSWKQVLRNEEILFSFSCTKLSKTGVGEEVRVLAHIPRGMPSGAETLSSSEWEPQSHHVSRVCNATAGDVPKRLEDLTSTRKPSYKCSHVLFPIRAKLEVGTEQQMAE